MNEGFSKSSLQQFQQNCIYAFHTIVFPSWVPPTFKIISSPRFAVNKRNFVEVTQKDVFYARFRGNGCITFLTSVKRYRPRGFKAQKARSKKAVRQLTSGVKIPCLKIQLGKQRVVIDFNNGLNINTLGHRFGIFFSTLWQPPSKSLMAIIVLDERKQLQKPWWSSSFEPLSLTIYLSKIISF